MRVIEVQDLSKKFVIRHEAVGLRYQSLGETLTRGFDRLIGRGKRRTTTTREEFWALKDLTCSIEQGDRVGVIGRNGAGKSTLLKILSRITEPTSGSVRIRGRVASLLEVGTGFHPELTGRENVFLNGAILGMSRVEIRRKFDEIIAFAEVEQFLDTPVKRYSSGMYVRLAFAVAAHLEPEILVVDEVLAVGDAEFQKKCLGRMQHVSEEGRTVIFVSHNMLAIKSLCSSGILLDKGRVACIGGIDEVTDQYMSMSRVTTDAFVQIDAEAGGITAQSLEVSHNGLPGTFNIEADLKFAIRVVSTRNHEAINVNLFFRGNDGVIIFVTCSSVVKLSVGDYVFTCVVPANTLNAILYSIDLMIVENRSRALHDIKEVAVVEGVEGKRDGAWMGKFPGLIRPLNYSWTFSKENSNENSK